ncbi:hypothetical protein COMA2_10360 [Candidatus Nitrospira nitrificans]|uniref:Uncharacterized protein n=1 Tax=Candidatus Nitrospira nitrificans TaxID=1742973 RepID=A0A0S4L323_9BACT|nr:hypothetical protein COMA2_10360 [Candidatus Nitrospira nitrificans]
MIKHEHCSINDCAGGFVVGFIAEKSGACCGKLLVVGRATVLSGKDERSILEKSFRSATCSGRLSEFRQLGES